MEFIKWKINTFLPIYNWIPIIFLISSAEGSCFSTVHTVKWNAGSMTHTKWLVTSWRVTDSSPQEITFPATSSPSFWELKTQNYYPHCKSQASVIRCWQNSSLRPNQSLNNLATPAELKRTTKAAKVRSKLSLIWNLSAAPCSCLSDCAFFLFFYRMRTPVAAVTQIFKGVFWGGA